MSDDCEKCFYIILTDKPYDGNYLPFLGKNEEIVYDIRKAKIITQKDVEKYYSRQYELQPVHKVLRLSQYAISYKKIKNKKPEEGELVYIMCERETVGSNASFWCWDSKGYHSDIRCAQIVEYSKESLFSTRGVDKMIPINFANKYIEHKIDHQDLYATKQRNKPWVLSKEFFEEKKAS